MKNFNIYTNNFNEISTFESYFYDPTEIGNKLIFPYFNVGIIGNHELNESNGLINIDYCYIIIENWQRVLNRLDNQLLYIGGVNITSREHAEMSFTCEKKYMAVPNDFEIRKFNPQNLQDSFWFPFDNNNFKKNIPDTKIEFIKRVRVNIVG